MHLHENWSAIKSVFCDAFRSSFHYAIATVNADGEPHITPIGSMILGKPGHGLYFEEFTRTMPINMRANKKICVLAVNSSRWYWIRSLVKGRFATAPAVRLYGTVGEARLATDDEIGRWRQRVSHLRLTKGHKLLWANMKFVRDIEFTRMEPMLIGSMTSELWKGRA